MIGSRCRARVGVYWLPIVLLIFLVFATGGCAGQEVAQGSPVSVAGLPVVVRRLETASESVTLFGPVAADVSPGTSLVVARLAIRQGAVFVIARDRAGTERARRCVARIGPSLVLLPVMSDGRVSVEVAQVPNAGSLSLDIESVQVVPVTLGDAGQRAAELAGAFERETGRLADPARENLVDNADFAEDDEVRGTPRNWFAYVPTSSDALTHSLHVVGMAPQSRPAVATGPVAVSPAGRYRLFVSLRVSAGPVVVRVVDYDELITLAEARVLAEGEEHYATLEFSPPAACHGVRVQFGPAVSGTPIDFALSAIQMEELP